MNTTTSPSFAGARIHLRTWRHPARGLGFTFIELLMALAVASVLLALGTPSFTALWNSNKLTSASSAFLSSIHLARSEATRRNGRVTLCKSDNGTSCASAGGWQQGWMVFHDSNNNGKRDDGEPIIERIQPFLGGVQVTGNAPVAKYVSFQGSGGIGLISGAFQAGTVTVTVCNPYAATGEARQIILNAAGRPRVQKINTTNCA